jgi:hypothetical protein
MQELKAERTVNSDLAPFPAEPSRDIWYGLFPPTVREPPR